MTSFPRWLDKAKATGARLISYDSEGPVCPRDKRKRDDFSDIPPFLLPLSVRVRLEKDRLENTKRSRSAPYDKTAAKRKHKLSMPTVLRRLTGPPTCPIVVAQYKDEYRGVGHEEDLHWALVVITDRTTLSGPSFQVYAQKRRLRRPSRASRSRPATQRRGPDRSSTTASTIPNSPTSPSHGRATATFVRSDAPTKIPLSGTPNDRERSHGREHGDEHGDEHEDEYETQWYTRFAPASLFDVSATVRTLCLGGVQVGSVRRADVDKLTEYLRSHPPVPSHAGWGARDYVLELLELLRPFKMLRSDLQAIHLRARSGERREVGLEDILPDLREVGRATQESIFQEEFRPCVKYAT